MNTLFTGEKAYVVSGPVGAGDGLRIRVQTGDDFGWIALDLDDPPVVAVQPQCPPNPFSRSLTVREVSDLTLPERLHCFGDRSIIIEPVISRELPSDIPYGGAPNWLADHASLQVHGHGGFLSDDGPLGAHLDPAAGLVLIEGRWYRLQGQLDHPAASTCTRRIIADEMGLVDPRRR